MSLTKRAIAEFIGTFWLVFGGCGAAIFACTAGGLTGIGYLGVSLAFGLTVMTMAFAIGHISGCHLNPAVTLGLLAANRFHGLKDTIVYIIAQILGGLLAATALFAIRFPSDYRFVGKVGEFATNGYGTLENMTEGINPFGGATFGATSAFCIEAILTCVFLLVIIGATDKRAPKGFAPIAIGLSLTLIHLISIPVTNTSVNPARSIAVAVFTEGEPLQQLPVFIFAPILGAIFAGILYKALFEAEDEPAPKKKCCCEECKHHEEEEAK